LVEVIGERRATTSYGRSGRSICQRRALARRRRVGHLADAKGAIWLAAAFVMTAALARRYDQADLLDKPHMLLLPLVVSGVNATLLALYWRLLRNGRGRPRFLIEWRRIVTLFWMTAPLAWLYGIPWERVLDPVGAVWANLWSLLIVAAWRVILTARFLSVLGGVSMTRCFAFLMVFADAVAVVLMALAPKPMVSLMGGIAHSPADALIGRLDFQIMIIGVFSFPLWAGWALWALFAKAPPWAPVPQGHIHRYVWIPVGVVTVLFAVPMIWTQPEQRLATAVNRFLEQDRSTEAIDVISAHQPSDLPPGFDPRPRHWEGEMSPSLWRVIAALGERPATPDWVKELWYRKLRLELESPYGVSSDHEADLLAGARALARDPEGLRIMNEFLETDPDGEIGEAFRGALKESRPRR